MLKFGVSAGGEQRKGSNAANAGEGAAGWLSRPGAPWRAADMAEPGPGQWRPRSALCRARRGTAPAPRPPHLGHSAGWDRTAGGQGPGNGPQCVRVTAALCWMCALGNGPQCVRVTAVVCWMCALGNGPQCVCVTAEVCWMCAVGNGPQCSLFYRCGAMDACTKKWASMCLCFCCAVMDACSSPASSSLQWAFTKNRELKILHNPSQEAPSL